VTAALWFVVAFLALAVSMLAGLVYSYRSEVLELRPAVAEWSALADEWRGQYVAACAEADAAAATGAVWKAEFAAEVQRGLELRRQLAAMRAHPAGTSRPTAPCTRGVF